MRMLSQPFKLNHLDDVANSYDCWHWWVTYRYWISRQNLAEMRSLFGVFRPRSDREMTNFNAGTCKPPLRVPFRIWTYLNYHWAHWVMMNIPENFQLRSVLHWVPALQEPFPVSISARVRRVRERWNVFQASRGFSLKVWMVKFDLFVINMWFWHVSQAFQRPG